MNSKAPSDERLLRRYAKNPTEELFTELTRRHWESAFALAYKCLGDSAAAEDVAQEVFLKLAGGLGEGFELDGTFRPWFQSRVLNAVRNRVRGEQRRSKRERAVASKRSESVEQDLDKADEAQLVRREVASLPEELRMAVVLRFFEGYTHAKVAEVLGWKKGTASDRIRRGVSQLRTQLAGASLSSAVVASALREASTVPAAPTASAHALWTKAHTSAGAKGASAAEAATRKSPSKLAAPKAMALAAGVVALAALAALWPSDDAPPPPPPEVATANQPPAGDDALADEALAPGALDEDAPDEEPAAEDDAGAEESIDAPTELPGAGAQPIAEDEQPVAALPAGLLQGRVVSGADGTPLEGAQVSTRWQTESMVTGGSPTSTDVMGRFSVKPYRNRPVRAVHVLVHHPGHEILRRRFEPSDLAKLTGPLELVLQPGGAEVRAKLVAKGTGAPLSGLKVQIEQQFGAGYDDDAFYGRLKRKTNADAAGVVSLGGLGAQAQVELTILPGQGYGAETFGLRASGEREPTRIEVSAAASIRLRVVGPNGQPSRHAAVDLQHLDREATSGFPAWRFAKRKRFEFGSLPAGRYRVSVGFPWEGATAEARRKFAADRIRSAPDVQREITLAAGEARELELQVEAAEHGKLTCKVRDGRGNPIGGAFIILELHGGDPDQRPSARTDASGDASFSRLEPGTYTVTLVQQSHPSKTVEVVSGKTASCRFEGKRSRVLRGRVVDPQGNPVVGARVNVSPLGGGGVEHDVTDAEGRFAVKNVEEGTVNTRVEAKGFAPFDKPVISADGAPEVVLELEVGRGLVVSGAVGPEVYQELLEEAAAAYQDPRYARSRGVKVKSWLSLADGSGRGGGHDARWTDEGTFSMEWPSLPSVSATLTLRIGERVVIQRAVGSHQESLDLGLIELQKGLTLRGRIDDPQGTFKPGAYTNVSASPINAGPGGMSLYETTLRPDGSFVLNGLPAERLKVMVYVGGSGDTSATATVEADPAVNADLGAITLGEPKSHADDVPQIEGFRFTITDNDGKLAKAGWKSGDLWVGFGENAFGEMNMEAFMQVMMELEARKKAGGERATVQALVQRGEERLTLPLDLTLLPMGPGASPDGFSMQPVQK